MSGVHQVGLVEVMAGQAVLPIGAMDVRGSGLNRSRTFVAAQAGSVECRAACGRSRDSALVAHPAGCCAMGLRLHRRFLGR